MDTSYVVPVIIIGINVLMLILLVFSPFLIWKLRPFKDLQAYADEFRSHNLYSEGKTVEEFVNTLDYSHACYIKCTDDTAPTAFDSNYILEASVRYGTKITLVDFIHGWIQVAVNKFRSEALNWFGTIFLMLGLLVVALVGTGGMVVPEPGKLLALDGVGILLGCTDFIVIYKVGLEYKELSFQAKSALRKVRAYTDANESTTLQGAVGSA